MITVKAAIEKWVNKTSSTSQNVGFSPLHFASFHGNIKLIKLLIKNGANMRALDSKMINMLHVAA